MQLYRADFIRVNHRVETVLNIDYIDSATNFDGGIIHWKGHKDQYMLPIGHPLPAFTKDDHGWPIAVDDKGIIITPDEI